MFNHRRFQYASLAVTCMLLLGLYNLQYSSAFGYVTAPVGSSKSPVSAAIGRDPHLFDRIFGNKPVNSTNYFHLLLPATSSKNENLCKTLLSLTALNYPAPILINWGEVEAADPYVQHLRKVDGLLRYLGSLPPARGSDLVLVVDGYDLWFQLPPEVLISRYYNVLEEENARLAERLGAAFSTSPEIYQSLVFGADKISWPEDKRRAAYWAVPGSPLPRWAFGPDTDSGRWREHNRPRWLNSGTIMGPAKDLVAMLEATRERIANAVPDAPVSDQYHMANIFARQEFARSRLANKGIPETERSVWIADDFAGHGHQETIPFRLPKLDPQNDYEFHITLDYRSQMFQTVAYYWKWLGWFSYNEDEHLTHINTTNLNTYPSLPEDILTSTPPLGHIKVAVPPRQEYKDPSREPQAASQPIPMKRANWKDLILGTNTVTHEVFPILHFTPPKRYLEVWWNSMWFFPYGEAILNSAPQVEERILATTRDGRVWRSSISDVNHDAAEGMKSGGGWDDRGAWHSWHGLCQAHEKVVFGNHRHPEPLLPPPPSPADDASLEEPHVLAPLTDAP